jgi:transposase
MTLVGVALHTREQTVAVLDTATGEREDLRLRHDGEEVERFYAGLRPPVTLAIESTGYALWFHALMRRLGHTLLVGDAAKIRASVVRKTKTDRRDARHILTLLSEKRLPTVWVPDPGDEQASYAQFTDLESALVTAGISFDRLSDPVAEYGQ